MKALITLGDIHYRESDIAHQLNKKYFNCDNLYLLCILKGAYRFFTALSSRLSVPHQVGFFQVKSYVDNNAGCLTFPYEFADRLLIKGKKVIIVEDIIDTGVTITAVKGMIAQNTPESVEVITLLNKPSARKSGYRFRPDYSGFVLPSDTPFVVGYGLDYNEDHRDLDGIFTMED